MKTIYGSLPFYDSLLKQDRVRQNAIIPIHCPRTQLPPFEIQVGTAIVATVDSIKLVSCEGAETDLTSGFFTSFPSVTASVATALGSYIQYNGTALSQNLPLGSYYVKITKSDAIYYSDWIHISTIPAPMLKFIKIQFNNTYNLGDIRYEGSFVQMVWLEAILNNPTHEMVNTGEEKNGIFIPERIVSKYIYSIITYVSRGLYRCLMRLPQHDTITITDEVGNIYSPTAGNIIIEPAEWNYYDVAKIVIKFNDNENTSFDWTY
jgi:hypothetical protein